MMLQLLHTFLCMAEKVVRRTTTKKTVRKTATAATSPRASVRRSTVSSTRKAPTESATASYRGENKQRSKTFIIGCIFFAVLLGVSAMIGYSDKGQLNVEATIASRIKNASPEEQESLRDVPIQQQQTVIPNGGLVGMGQSEPPPAPPAPISTSTDATASSTDVVATTTKEVVEETPADESSQEAQ